MYHEISATCSYCMSTSSTTLLLLKACGRGFSLVYSRNKYRILITATYYHNCCMYTYIVYGTVSHPDVIAEVTPGYVIAASLERMHKRDETDGQDYFAAIHSWL